MHFGAIQGYSGCILGAPQIFWGTLKYSKGIRGYFDAFWGVFWGHFEAILGYLGVFWVHFGGIPNILGYPEALQRYSGLF